MDIEAQNELAVLRMETEILWPERCAVLEDLLLSSLTLLNECHAQRNIARADIRNTDALYQQHLVRVEAYRKKVAMVARNRA